jgi:hypothetical protein
MPSAAGGWEFLGRRIVYVMEVQEFRENSLAVMRTIQDPFPMFVTYRFEAEGNLTRASIRVQGEARGFYKLAAPLLGQSVKRSITHGLQRLKAIMGSR